MDDSGVNFSISVDVGKNRTFIYSGHPWDTTSWLLYRGGLLIQWNLYIIVVTLETQPVDCYTEVVCLYSGTCI